MNNYNLFIGIDPGASGAMCIIQSLTNSSIGITLLDFKKVGIKGYADELRKYTNYNTLHIYLERVHAMPKQGVSSMFSFGQRLGELEGMLKTLDLDYETVMSRTWQKTIGVPPKSGKQGIYTTVHSLYPIVQLYGPKGGLLDGRCDALGIAHYAKLQKEKHDRPT